MKRLFIITVLLLLTSACSTGQLKSCDCDGISNITGECGTEIEINAIESL